MARSLRNEPSRTIGSAEFALEIVRALKDNAANTHEVEGLTESQLSALEREIRIEIIAAGWCRELQEYANLEDPKRDANFCETFATWVREKKAAAAKGGKPVMESPDYVRRSHPT